MKYLRAIRLPISVICFLLFARPAEAQRAVSKSPVPPMLVAQSPTTGTFYLLGRIPSPPFPFDPYHGQLPVYAYDGVFFVDDSAVSLFEMSLVSGEFFSGEEGGGMMLMSSPGPPGGFSGTNSATNLFCSSLTNFVVGYQSSTNGLSLGIAPTTNTFVALTIQTATNVSYDVFGTTNLIELALPSLSRTNWSWLSRANGGATSFSWGLTNWCERYFQLGTTNDPDGDSLTSAYESLVSHTGTNTWDTDGDGIGDGAEVRFGLNPRAADPAFTISITQPAVGTFFP